MPDGFRLAKVVVTNTVHAASNKEEFIAYIKPLTVPKQTVDMIFPIEIIKDDNIVTVSMQTGDGKTEFSFEQPNSEFVNAESVIAAALEHDREVAVNAAYIATAMKAIAKATMGANMATAKKKTATGFDCLNCTLPTHVCCGIPRQCREKYAKYLEKKAEAERKQKMPRTRRSRNVPNESI